MAEEAPDPESDIETVSVLTQTIQNACEKLAALGMETLVVSTGMSSLHLLGSALGHQFLGHNKTLIADFVLLCNGNQTRGVPGPDGDGISQLVPSDTRDHSITDDTGPQTSSQAVEQDPAMVTAGNSSKDEDAASGDEEDYVPSEENGFDISDSAQYQMSNNTNFTDIRQKKTTGSEAGNQAAGNETGPLTEAKSGSREKDESKESSEGLPVLKLILSRVKKQENDKAIQPDENTEAVDKENGLKFICRVCSLEFETAQLLVGHTASHDAFACDVCQKVCRTEKLLQKHLLSQHHKAGSTVCLRCGKKYRRYVHLRDHFIKMQLCVSKNKEGDTTKYVCKKCGVEFRNPGHLKDHLCGKDAHQTQAGQEVGNKKKLLAGRVKHSYNKPHECPRCHIKFKRPCHLKDHLKRKTSCTKAASEAVTNLDGTRSYQCQKCLVKFKRLGHLRDHQNRKTPCFKEENQGHVLNLKGMGVFDDRKIEYQDASSGEKQDIQLSELLRQADTKTCPICQKKFNLKFNCRRHILGHLKEKPFQCQSCSRWFTSMEALKRHYNIHNLKPYNCDKCTRRYETEEQLRDHQTYKCQYGEKPHLVCDICGHKSMSRFALVVHQRSHTGLKEFACEVCGKKLASKESVERHKKVYHQEERPWSCDVCLKTFKLKDTLRKHRKVHEEPKFKCELCGKGCTEIGNLKKHMLTHTKEKPFVCETCGKAYGRRTLLDNHQRLHTGERPFHCAECGKNFRSYGNLRQHKTTHSSVHSHICDVCGKTFKQRGRMNHHRKSHFIDYRWPCDFCEHKFKSIFMYKNHLAKFHPEMKDEIEERCNIKLYQCEICNKMYGDKEDLTRHIYIHKGLKPFSCRFCRKAFNDKSNMRQHEKIHTGEKKYACIFCFKTFIHNRTLQIHLKNVHSMKEAVLVENQEQVSKEEVVVMETGEYPCAVQEEECKQAIESVLPEEMIPVISEEQVLAGSKALVQQVVASHMMAPNEIGMIGARIVPVSSEAMMMMQPPMPDILVTKL